MGAISAFVAIGISAEISVNACSISISITFSINICIFAGMPDYSGWSSTTARKTVYDKKDAEAFLKQKLIDLKGIYDGWQAYLNSEQKVVNGRVIQSLEELREDILRIAKKQIEECQRIEQIIDDTWKSLQKIEKQYVDDEIVNDYVLFIMNCIQMLRDFTMTFAFGDVELVQKYETSPATNNIERMIMERCTNPELAGRLAARTRISTSLIENREWIAELKEKRLSDREDLEAARAVKQQELDEAACREESMKLIPRKLNEMEETERKRIDQRMEAWKQRAENLRSQANAVEEEKNSLSIFRRKRAPEYEALKNVLEAMSLKAERKVMELENERAALPEDIARIRRTYDAATSGGQNRLDDAELNIRTLEYRKGLIEEQLEQAMKKEQELAAKYEETVKDWPELSATQ